MSTTEYRRIQRQNFRDWKKLSDFLLLDEEKQGKVLINPKFSLNIPLRLAAKIQKNTLDDPILRQFLPLKEEEVITPSFKIDPVGDLNFRRKGRLLHKYRGRALLVTTGACAMHCRYCFRKNYEYGGDLFSFDEELALLREDETITEILLSGGDPLSLGNDSLKKLLDELGQIKHLTRLRFHTRFPIGIPERIDEGFLKMLAECRFQIYFVIHTNHFLELDEDVLCALKKVQMLGIPLLNQAVLLKGINDSVDALKALFEKLVDHGILPYYLHQLDPIQGSKHFEVDEDVGRALIAELSKQLPGYAIPKYVREIPGIPHKLLL